MPEGKNEFPVEIMREFYKDFSMKAARGAHKVGIIDDSDLFHPAAANSFLKTLEEPPPGSLLILLSSNLDLQLETIKSRCHIVRFAPLSDAHVRQLLEQRPEVDAKLLDRLVRLAGGSPGQALELADENLWTCRRVLLHGLAQPKVDSFGLALKFVECAGEAGKETAPQRRRAGQMLRLLIEAFSDVMRLQAGATARSAEPAELPLLNALAERARPEKINAAIERCLETETQLDRYVQISLVLEGLMDALGQVLEHPGVLPARYQGFNV
jgi:DNA polymerase-3 subunit delta'